MGVFVACRRNDIFTAATYYPFWVGIIPDEILTNATNAFGAFASSRPFPLLVSSRSEEADVGLCSQYGDAEV